ncbi:unnamed protein product [Rotaria sp. Silwood1]|nr:unnamed protein product [Rotaria sp. Silwood1]CAF3501481.1 unnamed protein product [Rotaria sp. Silwood1]CAF3503910.1 unnamed protein product [Rotaria sp. Silwood1]CAF4596576.1 unnamed protein product [Rotaria sp. Silwood1]CAF4683685.1 unnamed protein product [Rotaria sp. Silwood1]
MTIIGDNNTILNSTSFNQNKLPNYSVGFWIYLIMFILSICCSIFIFLQFIFKRTLRININNHVILAVLICSFLQVISELPLVLVYFRTHIALIPSDTFCAIWCYVDYVFNVIILLLICHASIERYLLVFHHLFIYRHLILLHYLPIIFSIIYPCLFYFGFIFFYPCISQYDYTKITCQGPCYLFERIPGSIDLLINLTLPLFISILSNIFLLGRVVHQKHRMKQQRKWKKNRRLVIQLISIVIVHNLIWLPIIICLLIELFSPKVDQVLIDLSVNLFTYSIYIAIMICPFVSLLGLHDIGRQFFSQTSISNKILNIIRPRTRTRVIHVSPISLTPLPQTKYIPKLNNKFEK